MKIRNLAFCGVMASILGVSGAYAAAGDATIIASKAYVDARDNAKQDKDNRVQTSQADYEATTGLTDDQRKLDYPSMFTLKAAVGAGTSALDGRNADSSTGVSAGAAADNNKVGMPVVKVTETDGIVTSELGAIGTKGISDGAVTYAKVASDSKTTTVSDAASASDAKFPTEKAVRTAINNGDNAITSNFEKGMNADTIEAYNAWAETPNETNAATLTDKISRDTGLDNVVSDTRADHANLIPRNSNIQKGIAYMKGNGIVNHTAGVGNEALTQNMAAADTAWKKEFTDQVADDHVPTVAAVEARVKAATASAQSNSISNHESNTAFQLTDAADKAPSVNTVKRLADTTEKVARDTDTNQLTVTTTGATDNTAPTTLTYATDMATMATAVNAKLDANSAITASTDTMNIVKYDANGLVTDGKKLDSTLNNINVAGGGSTGTNACSAADPCVLTYIGGNTYKWTQMMTDGLNAVTDGNS